MGKNGRLVLMRRAGESIFLELPNGDKIEVNVFKIQGTQVSLAIEAPQDVSISRDNAVNKKRRKVVDKGS